MRASLPKKTRIVVKIGSSLLVDASGELLPERFSALAGQLARLRSEGRELIVVSSGAIAAGLKQLKLKQKPSAIAFKQAIAAVGQPQLMRHYESAFKIHGIEVAQLLLTRADLSDRRRLLNVRHSLQALRKLGALPIINENDSVSVDEIKVGDNDNLSALVTSVAGAELLIILSDIDGVYEADPHLNPQARRLSVIEQIGAELKGGATDTIKRGSTGGMRTKLEAAEKARSYGIPTVIASGHAPDILLRIVAGEDVGTLIYPSRRLKARKHWLAFSLKPQGSLVVDAGAQKAIVEQGRSLLPSGIRKVVGKFSAGDPVDITLETEAPFARGLASYDAPEIERIKGQQSRAIEGILGYKYLDEIVHRNDLVILDKP